MPAQKHILVIDDDPSLQRVLEAALTEASYAVDIAGDAATGELQLAQSSPDLILLDLNLPDRHGLDVLRTWSEAGLPAPVVIITAQNTVENAIQAMQLGAYDYLVKPFDLDDLYAIVEEAIASVDGGSDSTVVDQEATGKKPTLIGTSAAMRDVYKVIGKTANTDATILITGESGTGKELVARAVHTFSSRANQPFVALNTAAIPADLLEAELFGYEKGAFTGANQASPGKFREAQGGTLLLDEIGDMPLSLQGKLLRVLQEREITPLGSQKTVPINVRILAATQVSLEAAIEAGTFRSDLYYRLNVVQVDLPPLRERIEDLEPLCKHFLARMAAKEEIPPKSLAADAIKLLQADAWPGNIRQLENIVRRVALLSPARELDAGAFVRYSGRFDSADAAPQESFASVVEKKLREYVFAMHAADGQDIWSEVIGAVEQVLLRLALEASEGNQLRAADSLGINRNTIRKKLTEYNIEPKSFRPTS